MELVTKELENLGLEKFVRKHQYTLCTRTLKQVQMASILQFDSDLVNDITSKAVPFDQNFTMYTFVEKKSTPELFVKALEETNNHVLRAIGDNLQIVNDDIARLMMNELNFLCDRTVNRFRFATALSSFEVIAVEDVHRDSQVNEKENLEFLYNAVINKRAWDVLRYALEGTGNDAVCKYLVDKNILQNEVLHCPLPFMERLKQKWNTNEMKGSESSGSKGRLPVNSSGLSQSDWQSSFTYASITFLPPNNTSVRISRHNFKPTDLTQILRNCKDKLEHLTLDDACIVKFDSFTDQILPLPNLKSYSIKFAQNRPHILTKHNYYKQALFFTPSSDQLCNMWDSENTVETIDFICKGMRMFKMSPKMGQLILYGCDILNPLPFFRVMSPSTASRNGNNNGNVHSLESFAGKGLEELEVTDIPVSVQSLHLRDCDQIKSTINFSSRFSHLKKLIISMSTVGSTWDLDLEHLAQLECLQSIAAENVVVQNTELIRNKANGENQNENKFLSLTSLLFHDCEGLDLSHDLELAEIAESENSIIMEKKENTWLVFGSSSYPGDFQQLFKNAFQTEDFTIT